MRGAKIAHVAKSMEKIHTLYKSINEIVQKQGITLNMLEDNVVSGRKDVWKAKLEM